MLTDLKYLNIISSQLRNFTKKGRFLFNCSCPICGDSTKDKRKARGYFGKGRNGRLHYFCHNNDSCSRSFDNFLKTQFPAIHDEYRMERFSCSRPIKRIESKNEKAEAKIKTESKNKMDAILLNNKVTKYLTPVVDLPDNHAAIQYLRKRKIAERELETYFFYTDKFKKFTNSLLPEKFSEKSLAYDEQRIIVVFFDEQRRIFAYQGRDMPGASSYAKYVTIKLEDSREKVFGLDRVDKTKTVNVVEGPIDSLFLDNSISVAGSDLISHLDGVNVKKRIIIYDNEPRSKVIVSKLEKDLEHGETVVIFPNNIKQKDINDMVLSGINVKRLIKENTYHGLAGLLRLNKWKRT